MIIAGIGCRRSVTAEAIYVLVRRAEAMVSSIDLLAAPYFRKDEAAIYRAAEMLIVKLVFVEEEALRAAQPFCVTRGTAVERATGFASIAEGVAIGAGGRLVMPRIAGAFVTVALAER
jgi:cobalamin biosynthesis protein CbiG